MKSLPKILAPTVFLILALVAFLIIYNQQTERRTAPRPPSDNARLTSSDRAKANFDLESISKSDPTIEQVLAMGPADWESKFDSGYEKLDPEFKQEVIMLAGELRNAIEAGDDPESEELKSYAETILILLKEREKSPNE
ncbi:MAG: hypothetical protein H7Y36_07630 [Armatimonadetes bacterium]|nr:hypothetical protein [Akkermansiaceae bacterium]